MRRHRSFQSNQRQPSTMPDLRLLVGVVSDRILTAMYESSSQLARCGVPHAVAGALAVGAYGCPRATKDVDFLVGDEAFVVHPSGIVTLRDGVPIRSGTVSVDTLSREPDELALVGAVEDAPASQNVGVVPLDCLVYLKLKSPRQKDIADVVELLKFGHDRVMLREMLSRTSPHLIAKLDKAIAQADEEQEEE